MVRHCTRCELRFPTESELTDHLSREHAVDTVGFERLRYSKGPQQAPLYADLDTDQVRPRRILVLANQTLGAEELHAEIARRLAEGAAEILVVVPATHSGDYPAAGSAGSGVTPESDDRGVAQARLRLERMVADLAAKGVTVTGEIGPPDPYKAAGAVLEREAVDEVLMATLPPGTSRWFALDVPARIRRRFSVPVSVLTTAHDPSPATTQPRP